MKITDTIIACCILHNICIIRGDHYEIDNDDHDDDDDCNGIDPHTTDVLTRFIRRELVGKTWMTKLQNHKMCL